MRVNLPHFEIWEQEPGLHGIYRQVERAGRVCYKSEDHQTEDSAEPFARRMMANHHTAMLEHATVYLTFDCPDGQVPDDAKRYVDNPFTHTHLVGDKLYVTTNLRVVNDNGWTTDPEHVGEPTEHHDRRITVHFTTQIAISREYNRHRVNSIAEQSTRYCNYSKDKFGNEIAINLPTWIRPEMEGTEWASQMRDGRLTLSGQQFLELSRKVIDGSASIVENWVFANLATERAYMNLIAAGRKPQEARVVLPLDTNTELVHTAFLSDWKHFFDLRALGTTGAPHPDAKIIALPLYEEFKRRGWID